jgi:hypothetical protein
VLRFNIKTGAYKVIGSVDAGDVLGSATAFNPATSVEYLQYATDDNELHDKYGVHNRAFKRNHLNYGESVVDLKSHAPSPSANRYISSPFPAPQPIESYVCCLKYDNPFSRFPN